MKAISFFVAVVLAAAGAYAQDVEDKFLDPGLSNWSFVFPHQYGNVGRLVTEKEGGQLVLGNRVYAFLREDFPGGVEMSFEWCWDDMGGGGEYADHLCILLRSSGSVSDKRPFLPLDGVYIVVDAGYGTLNIHKVTDGKVERLVEEKRFRLNEVPPAIPAGKWYKIKVVDDGAKLTLSLNNVALSATYERSDAQGKKLALSNREVVGPPGPHRSRIRNFVAKTPK